jgi:hypothetical protein
VKSLAVMVFLVVALLGGASAQEPQVRAKLEIKGDVWVGQKITLVVELLAPGFFSGSPSFDVPRIPGVLIIPPEDRPVLGSEQINGMSYTVQRHELAVFAQRAGPHEIPAFSVRFGFKRSPLDKDAISQRVMTPSLQITAKMPPGKIRHHSQRTEPGGEGILAARSRPNQSKGGRRLPAHYYIQCAGCARHGVSAFSNAGDGRPGCLSESAHRPGP